MGSPGRSALLIFALAILVNAQQGQPGPASVQIDASSQPAVDILHAMARAIGQCPKEFGELGPPMDVTSNVLHRPERRQICQGTGQS